VTFTLDPSQLAFYDEEMRLIVEPGEAEVLIGASSADIRARAAFTITGAPRTLRRDEIRPTSVTVA